MIQPSLVFWSNYIYYLCIIMYYYVIVDIQYLLIKYYFMQKSITLCTLNGMCHQIYQFKILIF